MLNHDENLVILTTKQKMAVARGAYYMVRIARSAIGLEMSGRFRRAGCYWELELGEGVDFAIYLLGRFEPFLVRAYQKLIKPGEVVFDIGANIGAHSLIFGKIVGPEGRVVAFEPTQFAFAKLMRNLSLNEDLQEIISPVQMMLAESPQASLQSSIYSSWPLFSNGRTVHPLHAGRAEEATGAAVASVDSFVADSGLQRLDWMKIDVDGNELTVLKGASDTLRVFRPRILMELAPDCHDENDQDDAFNEMVSLLWEARYRFYSLPNHKRLDLDPKDPAKAIPKGASVNVLAEAEV